MGVVKTSMLKIERLTVRFSGWYSKEGKGKGFKVMCKTCAAHAKKAGKPAKKATTKKK